MSRSKSEQVILNALAAHGLFRAKGRYPHGLHECNVPLPRGVNEIRIRDALHKLQNAGVLTYTCKVGGTPKVDRWIVFEAMKRDA